VSYQEAKSKDYGVNNCEGCLEKQRIIDRQFEEIQQLKQKLNVNQRRLKDGFFGSSTPSSQIPLKSDSVAENQAKTGGGQLGHKGIGRQTFTFAEADEIRISEVSEENCPNCECRLSRQSSNKRAVYELEVERLRKVYYSIERKVCPKCRQTLSGKVANVMPRMSLSNELIIEVAEQHYVLGRTLGQIAGRLGVNYATLSDSLQRMGKIFEPSLERLKEDYRQS